MSAAEGSLSDPVDGPISLGANMKAYRKYEEAEIEEAFFDDDYKRATELAHEALRDPRLGYYYRAKYEAMLATIPGQDVEYHTEQALYTLGIMEELIEGEDDEKAKEPRAIIQYLRDLLTGELDDEDEEEEEEENDDGDGGAEDAEDEEDEEGDEGKGVADGSGDVHGEEDEEDGEDGDEEGEDKDKEHKGGSKGRA